MQRRSQRSRSPHLRSELNEAEAHESKMLYYTVHSRHGGAVSRLLHACLRPRPSIAASHARGASMGHASISAGYHMEHKLFYQRITPLRAMPKRAGAPMALERSLHPEAVLPLRKERRCPQPRPDKTHTDLKVMWDCMKVDTVTGRMPSLCESRSAHRGSLCTHLQNTLTSYLDQVNMNKLGAFQNEEPRVGDGTMHCNVILFRSHVRF